MTIDSNKIKRISISEFRDKGYLKELNRRFLHPLGLALEVVIDDETGEEKLGGIWDMRSDPEGIYYDLQNSSNKRISDFQKAEEFIDNELESRKQRRIENLGFFIEPIPETKE